MGSELIAGTSSLQALPTLPNEECEGLQGLSQQQHRYHAAPGYTARGWKNLVEDFDE